MMRLEGNRITAETNTLTAVIESGCLVSLKSRATGEEFLRERSPNPAAALQLVYAAGEAVPVADSSRFGQARSRRVSPHRAEVRFHGWDGDGVVTISEDVDTGDLLVEPSAFSSRPGVRACRWSIPGIRDDLQLVAPLYQGVKLPLEDPLIHDTTWYWPHAWEAGLAILQGRESGLSVHVQDTSYRFKSLQVGAAGDPHSLGFDAEAHGPIDGNLAAGGLCWRLNVHQGDWRVPAGRGRSETQ